MINKIVDIAMLIVVPAMVIVNVVKGVTTDSYIVCGVLLFMAWILNTMKDWWN